MPGLIGSDLCVAVLTTEQIYIYFATPRTTMASDFRLKEDLPELTDAIVETYTEIGTINH